MSDDDNPTSSSDESEDIHVTGLVATRARRGNAGNLYESLRAHLDDEDLQKELLAEDEADDAEDYEGSEVEADDDALDSSSDEEDGGPVDGANADDLTGEKELLRAERTENSKKRKAQAAKFVVPAWHKSVKKVKLADEVTADDGESSPLAPPKKKKKSERSDWRPAGVDLPKRQSIRSSAVASREVTHANLVESAERARKQKATLQESAKRERAKERAVLTLEQRLEKCRRIEKETAKELGRFEREEAERIRLREEALLAKRRRFVDGPVTTTLTTSGYYENGKLKIKRLLHGSQEVSDILEAQKLVDATSVAETAEVVLQDPSTTLEVPSAQTSLPATVSDLTAAADIAISQDASDVASAEQPTISLELATATDVDMSDAIVAERHQPESPKSVQHESTTAIEPAQLVSSELLVPNATRDRAGNAVKSEPRAAPRPDTLTLADDKPVSNVTSNDNSTTNSPTPHKVFADTNEQQSASTTSTVNPAPPVPCAPIIREQAQRSLVILQSFESLEGISTKRSRTASALEPTAVAQILLPDSYPTFTDEQSAYLRRARKQKQDPMVKARCALTTWPGKYKDPKTGVVFADIAAYKMLQRVIAGGCTWNSMLECWVGPAYGSMGRPARGVPEEFDAPIASKI